MDADVMDVDDQSLIQTDEIEIRDERFFQIDFLKAVMIFLVIFDHTIPWDIKDYMGVIFWERISIPVFLVIMGFNMGISFQKRGEITLKKSETSAGGLTSFSQGLNPH